MSTTKPSKKKPKARAVVAAKSYVPTKAEHHLVSELVNRLEQAAPHAAAKVEVDGTAIRLSWDHPSQAVGAVLWASALGTTDLALAGILFGQLAHVTRARDTLSETDFNGALALVRGLAPTDATEAMLAAQMAAVHNASMAAAGRLAQADTPDLLDSASTAFNKLTRTFAMQVEALKKHRLKGEQTIKVQHVTVNDGGQAIVGNVQHAPGGSLKSERQSHELAAPDALGPALLGHLQTDAQPMSSSSGPRESRLPVPRRSSRSTKRSRQRRLPTRQLHK
jgi:hypothetical protein